MRRISDGVIIVCLLALAGCAATPLRPEAPAQATHRSTAIDTSGTFAKGFSRDEALRLLELCLNLNNPGDGPAYAADTSAWDPIYPDAADKLADELGPWHNAWKLWRSKTEAKTYAVVIRGTMADQTSIIEDVIATSVAQPTRMQAWQNGYLDFTLAQLPRSETHLGFTYGLAALLFARDKGILAELALHVPQGSKIYITGHSQGAAIAALLHSFLHYAINDPADRYHLANLNYSLNRIFSLSPSRGTDALKLAIHVAENAVNQAKAARARFAASTEDHTLTALQRETGLLDQQWMTPGAAMMPAAFSINYVGGGNVVPVFGNGPCVVLTPAGPTGDPLCQHHLPTYRALMKAQLSGP